ncbi:hypothetical protein [Chryseobacterium potabilaquae]|uniref:Uncharacterized protein n=1 Tax=Chryseobacterium potabilaquae TaxID=2675057 RepID=A0A6N4XEY2_9FLAO|nr:hypothetical protein [Chryseobacterium potabilaquae]CAA7197510.1 hypothetical protein CHRY9293_03575 [Chryseobacterium potabilaquae]
MNNQEKIEVLVSIGEKLWEDYSDDKLLEDEYLIKIYKVKKEINNSFVGKMKDLKLFANDLGYVLIKTSSFTIIQNAERIKINKN